jgi:hypothetical protein
VAARACACIDAAVTEGDQVEGLIRCRPFQMRQGALSSSLDPMESARLPSHVRCSPTIEGRPRTFTFFRHWMVGGHRQMRHRCRFRKRAGEDRRCLAGSASSETLSDAGQVT